MTEPQDQICINQSTFEQEGEVGHLLLVFFSVVCPQYPAGPSRLSHIPRLFSFSLLSHIPLPWTSFVTVAPLLSVVSHICSEYGNLLLLWWSCKMLSDERYDPLSAGVQCVSDRGQYLLYVFSFHSPGVQGVRACVGRKKECEIAFSIALSSGQSSSFHNKFITVIWNVTLTQVRYFLRPVYVQTEDDMLRYGWVMHQYFNIRLDIVGWVWYFGYCDIMTWHKSCFFLVLKAEFLEKATNKLLLLLQLSLFPTRRAYARKCQSETCKLV